MQHTGGIQRAKLLENRQATLILLDSLVDTVLKFQRIAQIISDHGLAVDIANLVFNRGAGLVVLARLGQLAQLEAGIRKVVVRIGESGKIVYLLIDLEATRQNFLGARIFTKITIGSA